MRRRLRAAWLLVVLAAPGLAAQTSEVLGEVRVHGNHTTPDAEVLALAGLTIGAAVTDTSIDEARLRLRQSGRFDSVELRKRFRSIENPNDILIIILVDEVAGVAADHLIPGALRRLRSRGMWLPVLDYADGYGFTYGARVTFVDVLGGRSRLSVPATWGGERALAVEVDRAFARGPVTRLEGTAGITRRVNPHFDRADLRRELRGRAERTIAPWLRVAGGARLTRVTFDGRDDTYVVPAAEIVLDTRLDPGFARNAVFATAAIEQLHFGGEGDVVRWTTDVQGAVGLVRASVLAVRAANVRAGGPLPPFEQSLLGGAESVRGYRFGHRAGDNLSLLSAEIRVPVTSPLSVGRLGVKAFVDAGTAYPHGAALADQPFDRGAGGGVFLTLAVLRAGVDVAWPLGVDHGRRPRWHFALGVSF